MRFAVRWLFDPFYALALYPLTEAFFAGDQEVLASAVLLAVLPRTVVSAAVGPIEGSHTVLLVIHVLAFVLAAIGPFGLSRAVHFVVLPLAFILSVLAPDVNS